MAHAPQSTGCGDQPPINSAAQVCSSHGGGQFGSKLDNCVFPRRRFRVTNILRTMVKGWLVLLAGGLTLCLARGSIAADNAKGVVEAVPTSQKNPATWRYTFDTPAGDWVMPAFKDDG